MSVQGHRQQRGERRPTMRDVAQAAGVSAMTVSRALHQPDTVSAALRERVLAACQALRYVPNHAASALAASRSRLVALLIPSLSSPEFADVAAGAQEILAEAGCQMLLGVTGYSREAEEAELKRALRHAPDGVILTGVDHSHGSWELLRRHGAPAVHTLETLPPDRDDCWSVGYSQQEAGRAAARHLVDQGYRRIAIVGARLEPPARRRYEGARDALREAGLHDPELELMTTRPPSPELGAELLRHLLVEYPDCDAAFFMDDELAQGALFQCARQSVPVPQRFGVVGLHGLPASAWTLPPLSTVATPRREMGRVAADMLLKHLAGETVEPRHVDLGVRLMARGSA